MKNLKENLYFVLRKGIPTRPFVIEFCCSPWNTFALHMTIKYPCSKCSSQQLQLYLIIFIWDLCFLNIYEDTSIICLLDLINKCLTKEFTALFAAAPAPASPVYLYDWKCIHVYCVPQCKVQYCFFL